MSSILTLWLCDVGSLEEFKVLHNELLKEHDTRRPNSATSLRRTTIKGIKPSKLFETNFGTRRTGVVPGRVLVAAEGGGGFVVVVLLPLLISRVAVP